MQGKKKGFRGLVALGVTALVLVVAGCGFWVWHEQPSFCNAVCHVPMDNYVEGYYQDSTLLSRVHERSDTVCLDCHEAKIDQQVSEGISWIKGDFAVDDSGSIVANKVTADEKMCTQGTCHDIDQVIAATENWGGKPGVNPHSSHQGTAIDCSNCHGVHESSFMYCNTCHDYELPQGWQNPR